jgi:hypothetical protein
MDTYQSGAPVGTLLTVMAPSLRHVESSIKITLPLGPWTQQGNELWQLWRYYYNSNHGKLYVRQQSGYHRCMATNPVRFSPTISKIDWQPTKTSFPVHACLTIQGNAWIPIIPPPSVVPTDTPLLIAATFSEFLSSLDKWETELFAKLTMHVDCYQFIPLVETQQTQTTQFQHITVSNSSDNSGKMTFGCIISLPDGTCLAQCSGGPYGPFGTTFHAKGYGFILVSWLVYNL